jgi:hypothetical protein
MEPRNRFRPPGWESIPGLLERPTNTGSASPFIHPRLATKLYFTNNPIISLVNGIFALSIKLQQKRRKFFIFYGFSSCFCED